MAITGVVQVFGTKKCADSRKAERWFKERSIKIQFVDLKEKGLSPGELRSVAARVGLDKLVDRESQRFRDKGLRVASFHGALLGSILAMVLFARRIGADAWSVMDLSAAATPMGLFFGRLANLVWIATNWS